MVPPFTGTQTIDLPAPCSFDFSLAATKYFAALEDERHAVVFSVQRHHFPSDGGRGSASGPDPLGKGSVFRSAGRDLEELDGSLLSQQRLVVLCVKMCSIRSIGITSRHGLPTWEQALERLLAAAEEHGEAMNRTIVDRIADAVLYEGYILYPYRPSIKNRQRWTFGGLYPEAYCPTAKRRCLQQSDGMSDRG